MIMFVALACLLQSEREGAATSGDVVALERELTHFPKDGASFTAAITNSFANRRKLEIGVHSSNPTVYLNAYWRLLRKTAGGASQLTGRKLGNRFIEAFEATTRITPPTWWIDSILGAKEVQGFLNAGRSTDDSKLPPTRYTSIQVFEKEREYSIPSSLRIESKGNEIEVVEGGRTGRFSTRGITPFENSGRWLRASVMEIGTVLCVGSIVDGRFRLFVFAQDGSQAWSAPGFGTWQNRGGVSGGWSETIEIKVTKTSIIVFGSVGIGSFSEAFNRVNGQVEWRFCTGYWEEMLGAVRHFEKGRSKFKKPDK